MRGFKGASGSHVLKTRAYPVVERCKIGPIAICCSLTIHEAYGIRYLNK